MLAFGRRRERGSHRVRDERCAGHRSSWARYPRHGRRRHPTPRSRRDRGPARRARCAPTFRPGAGAWPWRTPRRAARASSAATATARTSSSPDGTISSISPISLAVPASTRRAADRIMSSARLPHTCSARSPAPTRGTARRRRAHWRRSALRRRPSPDGHTPWRARMHPPAIAAPSTAATTGSEPNRATKRRRWCSAGSAGWTYSRPALDHPRQVDPGGEVHRPLPVRTTARRRGRRSPSVAVKAPRTSTSRAFTLPCSNRTTTTSAAAASTVIIPPLKQTNGGHRAIPGTGYPTADIVEPRGDITAGRVAAMSTGWAPRVRRPEATPSERTPPNVVSRMKVGAADDRYEREADAVAAERRRQAPGRCPRCRAPRRAQALRRNHRDVDDHAEGRCAGARRGSTRGDAVTSRSRDGGTPPAPALQDPARRDLVGPAAGDDDRRAGRRSDPAGTSRRPRSAPRAVSSTPARVPPSSAPGRPAGRSTATYGLHGARVRSRLLRRPRPPRRRRRCPEPELASDGVHDGTRHLLPLRRVPAVVDRWQGAGRPRAGPRRPAGRRSAGGGQRRASPVRRQPRRRRPGRAALALETELYYPRIAEVDSDEASIRCARTKKSSTRRTPSSPPGWDSRRSTPSC